MKKERHSVFTLITILFIGFLPLTETDAQKVENSDQGYLFLGPRKEIQSKRIKKDRRIQAFTRDGVIITDNPNSPWYQATCFAHGSVILDEDGKILKEIVICQATDADGDISWSVLWYPEPGKPGTFEIIQGIGKWAGITGKGTSSEEVVQRSDESIMPEYKISWEIDPVNAPFSDIIQGKEEFSYMDQCLSFHGPHIFLETSELSNGISLEFSSQSGVLMSMLGPETLSPRNGATCFDRGSTVKLNGQTQGDIMLLEDTDSEGDVAWLYHIWWYNKGPGIYQFVGGTGKWEGIQGKGVTRGMFQGRSDDHFMLKSELYWNLPH
ncbi:MAG: hypothetical protein QNK35_04995 [Bacteroides sp.]|nr:hypothetical protein [Bacteroides sp.]